MAIKSQFKPTQMTGSFYDRESGIVDILSASAAGSTNAMTIHSASMVGVLSTLASAVKRITGASTFASAADGKFFTSISPGQPNTQALGNAGSPWADLFLGSGAVINFNAGDMTLTSAANEIQVDGGNLVLEGTNKIGFGGNPAADSISVSTDMEIVAAADITLAAGGGNVKPSGNNTVALGVSGTAWSDLYLGDGGIVDWNGGEITITQTDGLLTVGGSGTGYLRANRLEIDAATDYIDMVGLDLNIISSADLVINPAGGDVYVDGDVFPSASNGGALGSTTLQWSDLFLAEGGVINWDNGDVTMTQTGNLLDIAGGNTRVIRLELDSAADYLDVSTDLQIVAAADVAINAGGGNVKPSANDGAALGVSGTGWSDLFLADGGVINVNAGNSTLTGGSALWTSNVAFQATRLRIDSAADYIDVSTDLQIVAAADVAINAGGGNVKPSANDGSALGVSGTAWSDLFLADAGVINWNAGNSTITGGSAGLTASVSLVPGGSNTLPLGSTGLMWADLFLGGGAVINFNNGNVTLTHSANDLQLSSGDTLSFGTANDYIKGDGSGTVTIAAGTALAITADQFTFSDAAKLVELVDNNVNALRIGSNGAPDIFVVNTTNASEGVKINGNLEVLGTTTTLDTTNLLVRDPVILFASGGTAAVDQNGGIAIASGSGTANQALVFGRIATNTWGFGRKDVQNGAVTTLADMTLVSARADKFEINGANDYIYTIDGGIGISSSGDIALDADGANIVFKDGGTTFLDFVANGATDVTLDAPGDIKFDAAGNDYIFNPGGTESFRFTANGTTDATFDVAGDMKLDAAGNDFIFLDNGTENSRITIDGSNNMLITSSVGDIILDSAGQDISFAYDGTIGGKINIDNNFKMHSNSTHMILSSSDGEYNVNIQSGLEITFLDTNATGSTWTAGGNMKLSDAATEWTNFKSTYGEVSLMSAIVTAGGGGTDNGKFILLLSGGNNSNGQLQMDNFAPTNMATIIGNISSADVNKTLHTYLNGQLMLSQSDFASGNLTNYDYAIDFTNNRVDFNFALEQHDVVQVIIE